MNLAKDNGIIRPGDYQFGKRKYIIPTGKSAKKALSKEQVKQYSIMRPFPEPILIKQKTFGYLAIYAMVSILWILQN